MAENNPVPKGMSPIVFGVLLPFSAVGILKGAVVVVVGTKYQPTGKQTWVRIVLQNHLFNKAALLTSAQLL